VKVGVVFTFTTHSPTYLLQGSNFLQTFDFFFNFISCCDKKTLFFYYLVPLAWISYFKCPDGFLFRTKFVSSQLVFFLSVLYSLVF
jgi:hypothetical protein